MKTETVVRELEEAAKKLGLSVRRERGSFRGGLCERNGEHLLMINKNHPPEVHLAVLAEALAEIDMEEVYLRPAVRQALEDAWARRLEVPMEQDESSD